MLLNNCRDTLKLYPDIFYRKGALLAAYRESGELRESMLLRRTKRREQLRGGRERLFRTEHCATGEQGI